MPSLVVLIPPFHSPFPKGQLILIRTIVQATQRVTFALGSGCDSQSVEGGSRGSFRVDLSLFKV